MKKRKVIFVENGIGYGGAIICLRHLVSNLDPAAYDSMLVTGRTGERYKEIAAETDWRYIRDRHLDTPGWRSALEAATWPDKVPGLRWILSQIIARLDDLFNFLPFFLRLLWTAWRFRPDIIHTNNEPLCNRAAVLVARLLNIKLVAHVRSNLRDSWMLRKLYQYPDRFVSVSHWVSDALGELDVPADKRRVIYDGIELDHLDPTVDGQPFRQQAGLEEQDFAVGLVGLIIPWKGQSIFLDAAAMLRDRIPNLKMLVVGGTPDECQEFEAELRTRVEQENLQDVVIFTGNVNNMPVAYSGLDVVVSASTSPEPLGTMVIECMTMARPLIGPAHGGAAEMADHNETALLFEPGNARSLADAIARMYEEQGLRQRLGTAAREKALATFAVKTHVERIDAVYDELLKTGS